MAAVTRSARWDMTRATILACIACLGMISGRAAFAAASDDWNAPAPYLLANADATPNPAPATAQTQAQTAYPPPESPLSFDYLHLLWSDTVETVTEPTRWDRDDWRNAA